MTPSARCSISSGAISATSISVTTQRPDSLSGSSSCCGFGGNTNSAMVQAAGSPLGNSATGLAPGSFLQSSWYAFRNLFCPMNALLPAELVLHAFDSQCKQQVTACLCRPPPPPPSRDPPQCKVTCRGDLDPRLPDTGTSGFAAGPVGTRLTGPHDPASRAHDEVSSGNSARADPHNTGLPVPAGCRSLRPPRRSVSRTGAVQGPFTET